MSAAKRQAPGQPQHLVGNTGVSAADAGPFTAGTHCFPIKAHLGQRENSASPSRAAREI